MCGSLENVHLANRAGMLFDVYIIKACALGAHSRNGDFPGSSNDGSNPMTQALKFGLHLIHELDDSGGPAVAHLVNFFLLGFKPVVDGFKEGLEGTNGLVYVAVLGRLVAIQKRVNS